MGALNNSDLSLSHRNIPKLPYALVSTKEAFAYFCLLTKVCRSQSASAAKQRVAERSRSDNLGFGSFKKNQNS